MLGKGCWERGSVGGRILGKEAHWRGDAGEGCWEGGLLKGVLGKGAGEGPIGEGKKIRKKVSNSMTLCSHCRAC